MRCRCSRRARSTSAHCARGSPMWRRTELMSFAFHPVELPSGSDAQRGRFLPAIVRGECCCCIGMSEPNAGSDLASVRTRGTKTPHGWRISGQKVWTTHAHQAHMMIALVRTQANAEGAKKQEGLSQFLVDLKAPGVRVRPISDLAGEV